MISRGFLRVSAPLCESNPSQTVAQAIRDVLLIADPYVRAMATRALRRDWRAGRLAFAFDTAMPDQPARAERPELLPPSKMPKRGKGQSLKGRIALFHALAHIEFVAIALALDMAGRFGAEMSPAFVGDFLDTAADEAMHFVLLDRRLRSLGSFYGDLPAHGGLWDSAIATRHDVAARLAIVPMVLEARALDVTPAMIGRLREAGDERSAGVLQRIFDDEIRHVRLGADHFLTVAEARGANPGALWKTLVNLHFSRQLTGPFNDSARRAAGLSPLFDAELV